MRMADGIRLSRNSPRRPAETFGQEVKKNPDLWGSLPARWQQCPQRKVFRFLQVLQERFEEPFLDRAGNNIIAKADDPHPLDCQPQRYFGLAQTTCVRLTILHAIKVESFSGPTRNAISILSPIRSTDRFVIRKSNVMRG